MDRSSDGVTSRNDAVETIDDWGLSEFDFHVFAQHERRKIYSGHFGSMFMEIECIEALTPVDMINLGSGIHDATGHCVWLGAFLMIKSLEVLSEHFAKKNVIELGSGTGIGGIALLRSRYTPSRVVLTDADENALELCRRNCKNNKLSSACYKVCELTWGDDIERIYSVGDGLGDGNGPSACSSEITFDTVLATDVLYDIGLLPPLFQTAVNCLTINSSSSSSSKRKGRHVHGGIFVLAHVPRACYSSENPPVDNLEQHIIARAAEFGFGLKEIIRPSALTEEEVIPDDALNDTTLEEMEQVGAAVLVFELESIIKC